MKRFPALCALLACCALLAVCGLAFAACRGEEALSGSMTLVLDDPATAEADAVFEVPLAGFTSADTAADVLDALAAEGKLCYEGSRGAYGLMLTAVGVIEEGTDAQGDPVKYDRYILRQDAAAGVYLYLYTSVEADAADYEGMTYAEYGGQALAESMAGIGAMTIEDGAVVYITSIVYGG